MFDRAPSFDARMTLLRYVNIRKRELFKLDRQHFEWGLLVFHRVAVLNSRTANELSRRLEDSIDRDRNFMRRPLSIEIEASALRSTMRYCRTFLTNHFETSEDEDLRLLNKDDLIVADEAEGFYKPYGEDRGGIAPEAWHISYRPAATKYQDRVSPELLIPLWRGEADACGNVHERLAMLEVIEPRVGHLMERFVAAPES